MKRVFKNIILIVIMLSIVLSAGSCNFGNSSERFDKYIDESFEAALKNMDVLSLNYILQNPENFGITEYNNTFGYVFTESAGQNDFADLIFNMAYTYDDLTEEQKLIYDIFKYNMDLSSKGAGFDYYNDFCSGSNSVCSYLIILLAEFNFYKKADIDNYLELLGTIKEYFEDIAAYEAIKSQEGLFISDESLDLFIKDCDDFINSEKNNILLLSFEEKINDFNDLTEDEKKSYIRKNEGVINYAVIPAYEYIRAEMEKLRGTGINKGGTVGFLNGDKYYEYLAAVKTGSQKSIAEIKNIISKKTEEYIKIIISLEEKDNTLPERFKNMEYNFGSHDEILKKLQEEIKRDFPALPEVDYNIKYVSEYMQEVIGNPAFYLTPPIDNVKNNVIYINNNEKYQNMNIFTTLAHEGYPGHLYQSVYFSSLDVNPVRKIMNCQGYSEGWATYVEMLSYEYLDCDDNLKEYMRAYAMYNLLTTAVIDISINYDGEDYTWYRSQYTKDSNEEDLKSYFLYTVNNPAASLPYLVGCLEIMEMRSYAEDKLKNEFDLKEFHKTVLDVGEVPLHLVWEKVEKYVETGKVPGIVGLPENSKEAEAA